MTPKKPFVLLILISCTFILLASSCSGYQWLYFHNKEIKGSVIDAETKEPIKGVIVVAMWRLTEIPGEGFGGYEKIIVTESSANGNFVIPSWMSFKPWKVFSLMHELAPEIVIYEPGYQIYHSQKYERERLPYSVDYSEEERKKFKEKFSIDPVKLKKDYNDEDILKNFSEFESQADFPDSYYSREQLETIFNIIEASLLQLSEVNGSKQRILEDITEYKKYWMEKK